MSTLIVAALAREVAHLDTDHEVLVTGPGKVRAAAALAHRLGRAPVDRVVNVGTAGGLDPGMAGLYEVGTVVEHDIDAEALEEVVGGSFPRRIELTAGSGAVLATGDSIVRFEHQRELVKALGATLVDMEAYALAHVATTLGVPIRVVKYVSDAADEDVVASWQASVAEASRQLGAWLRANAP